MALTAYLAVRETKRSCWSNVISRWDATPWGAGLCVRASVADAYCKLNNETGIMITGRHGSNRFGSEDVEISWTACLHGFGVGVFPELKLTHLIPKARVSQKYLLGLYEGTAMSNIDLEYRWLGKLPQSPVRPWGLLSIVKNLVTRRGLDRRMYLATIRALISARRIIASTRVMYPIIDNMRNASGRVEMEVCTQCRFLVMLYSTWKTI